MNIIKKAAAVTVASMLTASSVYVSAETEQNYLCGDLNFSFTLDITDFVQLKSIITGDTEADFVLKTISDMNCDGTTDSSDILIMQQYLLGETDDSELKWIKYPEEIKEPDNNDNLSPLISSSLKNANSCTQSTGTAKSLNFFVEFNNSAFKSSKLSESELNEELFGAGKTKYPFESASAYLERSSYGNFTISGNCVYYHVNGNIEDYSSQSSDREKLVMTIMKDLDSIINYSDYDADGDGDIDILTVTPALDSAGSSVSDFWYGATHTWYHNDNFTLDNVRVNKFIGMDVMPYTEDMYYYKQTYLHELGHMMGLSDYYKYSSSDYEGLKGKAGFCRMDDSIGDYTSFSKLMLGWLRTDEVQIYNREKSGEQIFTLDDSSVKGSCLILPLENWDGSYTSEYFLIEYVSGESNNADVKNYWQSWWSEKEHTGFRILHVEAEMYTDYWGQTDFKYDNYSDKYNGDDKQRILRLVNPESKGFYKAGDSTDRLMAYDGLGYETINSGYTVEFAEEQNGNYVIKVRR